MYSSIHNLGHQAAVVALFAYLTRVTRIIDQLGLLVWMQSATRAATINTRNINDGDHLDAIGPQCGCEPELTLIRLC